MDIISFSLSPSLSSFLSPLLYVTLCLLTVIPLLLFSHIFQPVMDALVYVATHLKENEQQMEFLQRVLYSFINQGIEGKRAIERKDMFNQFKASSSSFSLGLLLPAIATVSVQYCNDDSTKFMTACFRHLIRYMFFI